jgi:adenylate kinase family enzyme
MPKLIMLRGNAGSGKSTVAQELAKTASHKIALVEEGAYRIHMFFPVGEFASEVRALMAQNVAFALEYGFDVLWVSIFHADRARGYFRDFFRTIRQTSLSSISRLPLKRPCGDIRHARKDMSLAQRPCASGISQSFRWAMTLNTLSLRTARYSKRWNLFVRQRTFKHSRLPTREPVRVRELGPQTPNTTLLAVEGYSPALRYSSVNQTIV